MKTRLLIITSLLIFFSSSSVYAPVPFVDDDNLIDNLKQNRLPIGQGIYMDFIFFLVLLGGGIGGIIFVIRRKRK